MQAFAYLLQVATMLILVLAANTGFADFPRLASIHAGDGFLPRQFTRGHRLVFSNGIIALAGAAGIARRRLRRRGHQADPSVRDRRVRGLHALAGGHGDAPPAPPRAGWQRGVVVNGVGAMLSAGVVLIVLLARASRTPG